MTLSNHAELTELKTGLPSMFLECALYGIYTVLYIISTCLLTARRRNLPGRIPSIGKRERFSLSLYLVLGSVMFLCLSAVWILSWLRYLKPELMEPKEHSTALFWVLGFTDGTKLSAIVYGRYFLLVVVSKLNDIIITYRLWVISCRSFKAMAFPCFLWLGYLVICTGLVVHYVLDRTIERRWVMAFIALSLSLNVYFTGYILNLVKQTRSVVSYGGADIILIYKRGMAIVIESAALYTLWLLLLLVASAVRVEVLSCLFGDTLGSVAGIVTMLVNVRVGLGWAWEGPSLKHSHESPGGMSSLEWSE